MSIVSLVHRMEQDAATALKEAGSPLRKSQLVVLDAIFIEPGLSQTDVVDRTGVDRSTIADVVRRLMRGKLIKRARSKADARAYVLNLTEDGETALMSARKARKSADKALVAKYPFLSQAAAE